MHNIIVKPIITEKSIADAGRGKFTFAVATGANKDVVKLAIEQFFDVKVVYVATTVVKGRTHRTGTRRIEVTKRPWKKAVVQLKEGQKIDLFDIGSK